MPRKTVDNNSIGPYHVTGRCINKEWFNIPMDEVWDIFSDYLYYLSDGYGVKIHSFVLMSNHYHLLVSTPNQNLSEAMMNFNREVSKELNRNGNRINRTFAGRFFRSHITNYHYFMNCYKYIYLNPLVVNLCENVQDYKYSTLNGLLGNNRLTIPVIEDSILFNGDVNENLKWLNILPNQNDLETMRLALRRKCMSYRRDPISRKSSRLEVELL